MNQLAIIGGTGLYALKDLEIIRSEKIITPYGEPSAAVVTGNYRGKEVLFLPRHGEKHQWPPHCVNYRANIWALKQSGAKSIVAINAVGGITDAMAPAVISIPHQIIDYTWGREHTYSDSADVPVAHIDFSYPYTTAVRDSLLRAAKKSAVPVVDYGVYGCTQGPRLESAAEIERMRRDGCDLVGMTAMPEAALARELGLDYASICVIANWAAGCTEELITMEMIEKSLATGMVGVFTILDQLLVS